MVAHDKLLMSFLRYELLLAFGMGKTRSFHLLHDNGALLGRIVICYILARGEQRILQYPEKKLIDRQCALFKTSMLRAGLFHGMAPLQQGYHK